MPISVEIEGKGMVAEFPDGTDQSIIDATIKRDYFNPEGKMRMGGLSDAKEWILPGIKKGMPSVVPGGDIAAGTLDFAATMLTGSMAWGVGLLAKQIGTGVAAINNDPNPSEFGKIFSEQISHNLTWQPKTEMGKGAVALVSKPFEFLNEQKEKLISKPIGEITTPEVGQLYGDLTEIMTFGVFGGLAPKIKGLFKTKPEAFDFAKTMERSLQDITDPVRRKEFVDEVMGKAAETGRDPWVILEETQARMLPAVQKGKAVATIPEKYAVTPDGQVIIPERPTATPRMTDVEIRKARKTMLDELTKDIPGESYVKGEDAFLSAEKTKLAEEPTVIGEMKDFTIEFSNNADRIRFDGLLEKPSFLWDAQDKAFYNRMVADTEGVKLFAPEETKLTPETLYIERGYRTRESGISPPQAPEVTPVETKPAEGTVTPKQPWEMTKAEYDATINQMPSKEGPGKPTETVPEVKPEGGKQDNIIFKDFGTRDHEYSVQSEDWGDIYNYKEMWLTYKGEVAKNWKDGHIEYDNIKNPIARIRFTLRNSSKNPDLLIEEIQGPDTSNKSLMPPSLKNRMYDRAIEQIVSYAIKNNINTIILPDAESIHVGLGWGTGDLTHLYDKVLPSKLKKLLGEPDQMPVSNYEVNYWTVFGAKDPFPNPSRSPGVGEHRNIVSQAIYEGKPVPPEVLKEYPELTQVREPRQLLEDTFANPTPENINTLMDAALEYTTKKKVYTGPKGGGRFKREVQGWRTFADAIGEKPGKPDPRWKELGFTSARDFVELTHEMRFREKAKQILDDPDFPSEKTLQVIEDYAIIKEDIIYEQTTDLNPDTVKSLEQTYKGEIANRTPEENIAELKTLTKELSEEPVTNQQGELVQVPFTLSGNQPITGKEFIKPELKGERLPGMPEKATTQEIIQRRTLKNTLSDINTAIGKKGAVGDIGRTPEQQAAIDRLGGDMEALKARAREAGLSLQQYLINEGIDPKIALLVSNHSNPININIAQTAEAVKNMFDETDSTIKARNRTTLKKVKEGFVRAVLDVSGNVKQELVNKAGDLGKEAVVRRNLVAGAAGKAGEIVEGVHNQIYKGLSNKETGILNRIIQSRRTIEIDSYKTGVEHPGGLGGEAHKLYLENITGIEKISEKQKMKLLAKSNEYFAVMDTQLQELKDAGIISQEQYEGLSKHVYSPRQFLQHLDPEIPMTIGGKKINVTESGIKSLDEGSTGLLENNSERLMAEVVARTQGRIFKNNANRALYDIAAQVPDNGIVSIKPMEKGTELSTFIDGDRYTFFMEEGLSKEWITSDPLINRTLAEIVQWTSGSKILKAVATGYNPAFIITNMPRDMALIWQSTTEYSSHLPSFIAEMTHDLATVMPDVFKRTGRVLDFANEGGEMTFLTHYGRFGGKGHLIERINSFSEVMGWLGETSELWTRLALRERALRNGAKPYEATAIARNYLDFSQGGSFIKAVDTAIPYLNASVQGTRSIFRAAKNNPGIFTYKAAQLGAVATGLYYANYMTNPECWKQVTDRDKEANFIITTPLTYQDDKGQTRYLYFKIAKDQGQRIITSVFESVMAKYHEGKFPSQQIWMAWEDLINVMPTDMLPPVLSSSLGYLLNKDFWTKEEIWRGPKVEAGQEYDLNRTGPAFKALGNVGLSPARSEYAVGRIIPFGNPFVGLVGGGLKTITGQLPEEIRQKSMEQLLTENPTIRRIMSSTNPYNPYKEDIDKIKEQENTRRFVQSREYDDMLNKHFKDPTPETAQAIKTYIVRQPEEDRERLIDRAIRTKQYFELPDRTWWMNVVELSPESRAVAFWARYSVASEKEKQQLLSIAENMDGMMSDRFTDKLAELAGQSRKTTNNIEQEEVSQ